MQIPGVSYASGPACAVPGSFFGAEPGAVEPAPGVLLRLGLGFGLGRTVVAGVDELGGRQGLLAVQVEAPLGRTFLAVLAHARCAAQQEPELGVPFRLRSGWSLRPCPIRRIRPRYVKSNRPDRGAPGAGRPCGACRGVDQMPVLLMPVVQARQLPAGVRPPPARTLIPVKARPAAVTPCPRRFWASRSCRCARWAGHAQGSAAPRCRTNTPAGPLRSPEPPSVITIRGAGCVPAPGRATTERSGAIDRSSALPGWSCSAASQGTPRVPRAGSHQGVHRSGSPRILGTGSAAYLRPLSRSVPALNRRPGIPAIGKHPSHPKLPKLSYRGCHPQHREASRSHTHVLSANPQLRPLRTQLAVHRRCAPCASGLSSLPQPR